MELTELKTIGLTEGEIKLYNALLELGESTRTELSKKSGISPSKIYDVANRLLEKGIIEIGLPHFNLLDHHRDLTHRFFCTTQTFCDQVQTISYQTHFKVKAVNWVGKWKTLLKHFISLRTLELMGWPIYEIRWWLTK